MIPDWDDYSDSVLAAEARRRETWGALWASTFESPSARLRRRVLAALRRLARFWLYGER